MELPGLVVALCVIGLVVLGNLSGKTDGPEPAPIVVRRDKFLPRTSSDSRAFAVSDSVAEPREDHRAELPRKDRKLAQLDVSCA